VIESVILERMNASLSIVTFCALVIFARYIWKNLDRGYWYLRPAIAFASLWVGDTFLRTVLWYVRHFINKGGSIQLPVLSIVTGNAVLMVSVLCCIRVFSETDEGNLPWLITLFIALVAAIVSPLV
jgi:hypothetical protein